MRAISFLAAAMLAALSTLGTAGTAKAGQAFASYAEIALRTGPDFPKWQIVRERVAEDAAAVESCIKTGYCRSELASEMADELEGLMSEPALEKAKAVHWFVNTRPYREDQRQFGRSDVWQTPSSFWRHGGDCEDFAIAKYMALRALGFSASQLRLTILTSRSQVHAVLLIEIDGAWYVSDNLIYSLRALDRYDGWKPIFSVSDAGAWRYVARPLADAQEVARTQAPANPEPAGRELARTDLTGAGL